MFFKKSLLITEREILYALKNSTSLPDAANFLNINLATFRKYAALYKDSEGDSLLKYHIKRRISTRKDKQKAKEEKKAKRALKTQKKRTPNKLKFEDFRDGKRFTKNLTALKNLYVENHVLKDECSICGFSERRISDYESPLSIVFKDTDITNTKPENIELCCLNCMFLYYNINPKKGGHHKASDMALNFLKNDD